MLLFFKYEKYLQSLVPKALTSIVLQLLLTEDWSVTAVSTGVLLLLKQF